MTAGSKAMVESVERNVRDLLGVFLFLMAYLCLACGGEDDGGVYGDEETGDNESVLELEMDIEPTGFVVGYAEVDVSPPLGTILGGYGGPAQNRGITAFNDPLMAQILYVANDAGQNFMMISLDTAGYFYDFGDWGPGIKQLRENISEKVGDKVHLPPEHILLGASHSHAAIDLVGFWQAAGDGVPLDILNFILENITDAAVEAVDSAEGGEIFAAETELVGYTDRDSGCSTVLDNTVSVLQARDGEGTPLATLVNYAKHPTMLPYENTVASADFIWGLREEIQEVTGAPGMYMQGFIAAVHGGPEQRTLPRDEWEKTYAMGKVISDVALEALDDAKKVEEYAIENLEAVYSCGAKAGYLFDMYQLLSMPKRNASMEGDEVVVHEIPVSWHRIGTVEFAVFPGEGTPEYSLALREKMTGEFGFVVGLGNDCIGYILDPESVAADPSGQLEGYEMLMGLGERSGLCAWEAMESLGWFDGAN